MFGLEDIKNWLAIINVLGTGVLAVVIWLSGKDKATNSRIDEFKEDVDARLDLHNKRLSALEGRYDNLPTHDDLTKVQSTVQRSNEKLDQLLGENRANNRMLGLMHEHLLNKPKE